MSRLERLNATRPGFRTSSDGIVVAGVEYWVLVFSRSAHARMNFRMTFVGGFSSSRILNKGTIRTVKL